MKRFEHYSIDKLKIVISKDEFIIDQPYYNQSYKLLKTKIENGNTIEFYKNKEEEYQITLIYKQKNQSFIYIDVDNVILKLTKQDALEFIKYIKIQNI